MPNPERFSGDGSATAAFLCGLRNYRLTCACLAERVSAPPLVYDKHTPNSHSMFCGY